MCAVAPWRANGGGEGRILPRVGRVGTMDWPYGTTQAKAWNLGGSTHHTQLARESTCTTHPQTHSAPRRRRRHGMGGCRWEGVFLTDKGGLASAARLGQAPGSRLRTAVGRAVTTCSQDVTNWASSSLAIDEGPTGGRGREGWWQPALLRMSPPSPGRRRGIRISLSFSLVLTQPYHKREVADRTGRSLCLIFSRSPAFPQTRPFFY